MPDRPSLSFLSIFAVLGRSLDAPTTAVLISMLVVSVSEVWAYQYVGLFPSQFYRLIGNRDAPEIWNEIKVTLFVCVTAAFLLALKLWIADRLAVRLRFNLGHKMQDQYIEHRVFCLMKNAKDHEIDNQDSRITQDVSDWASFASTVMAKLIQTPMIVIYYSILVSQALTVPGYLCVIGFSSLSLLCSKLVMKPVMARSYVYETAQSNFRNVHSLVSENAETICVSKAQENEKESLNQKLGEALAEQRKLANMNLLMNSVTMTFAYFGGLFSFLMIKYFHWTEFPKNSSDSVAFCSSTSFKIMTLVNGLTAATRIGSDITQLGKYSCRVQELWSYLFKNWDVCACEDCDSAIEFKKVTILAHDRSDNQTEKENRVVLLKDLSFRLEAGQSLFISGPSGIGKSTLVRVIGRIWPDTEGTFCAPKLGPNDMIILPKDPYLPQCDIHKCLAFPKDEHDVSLDEIHDALNFMQLSHILVRPPESWWVGLSQGELQRVALIRAWVHKPRFLILDEATNAIPEALEEAYIRHMIQLGTSVITVGHHQWLRNLHDFSLDICDSTHYKFYQNKL